MKVVKKFTAVFLSVLFIFLTFSIMGFADTTEAEESIPTDFISAVSKMISHYDSSFGASSGGISETCRIIVKHKQANRCQMIKVLWIRLRGGIVFIFCNIPTALLQIQHWSFI